MSFKKVHKMFLNIKVIDLKNLHNNYTRIKEHSSMYFLNICISSASALVSDD